MIIRPKQPIKIYRETGVYYTEYTRNADNSFFYMALTTSHQLRYVSIREYFGVTLYRFFVIGTGILITLTKKDLEMFNDRDVFALYLKAGIPI